MWKMNPQQGSFVQKNHNEFKKNIKNLWRSNILPLQSFSEWLNAAIVFVCVCYQSAFNMLYAYQRTVIYHIWSWGRNCTFGGGGIGGRYRKFISRSTNTQRTLWRCWSWPTKIYLNTWIPVRCLASFFLSRFQRWCSLFQVFSLCMNEAPSATFQLFKIIKHSLRSFTLSISLESRQSVKW